MSLESELAQFVTQTKYEDLPQDVVEATKRDVIDTLGVALGGSGAPGVKEVVQLMTDLEVGGRCHIIAYGNRVPPHAAALANATMAHARDFDDTHDLSGLHAGVTVVPAAFAISQYLGGVSGKDFVTAVTLGIDVGCRMTLATKLWIGWMRSPLYGYFSVATTVGKLLGLNEDGILNAWGLAYAQAASNQQCVLDGALAKRVQAGFAASGGILAALMAAKGITGAKESMEGKYGFYNLYQRGEYDRKVITANLGKTFEVTNLSYKPYPCCRALHCPIDVALKLQEEHNIPPEQIDEVIVEVCQTAYDDLCLPVATKHKPRTIVDAQFSIPYAVATALTKRRAVIEDFTEEAIRDKDVLLTLSKLRSEANPEISGHTVRGLPLAPCRLTVKAKGRTYSTRVDNFKGTLENPMSDREIELKFRDCASHAVKPLSPGSVDKVIDTLNKLETVSDAGQVLRYL